MKRILRQWGLFGLFVGSMLPSPAIAQTAHTTTPAEHVSRAGLPAKTADISTFDIAADGALRIHYSEGTRVVIPKEKGRFAVGDDILTQETFSDIHVADDRQHIGWLADYMICAQSYPCPALLVILRSGHQPTYISPPFGIMWCWMFLEAGKQVVVQFGFPHGDATGAYALYDTETGRELGTFSPTENKEAPEWVQQLRRSNR